MRAIACAQNHGAAQDNYFPMLSPEIAEEVLQFHSGIPRYEPTPVVSLQELARAVGVEAIWMKDEAKRFGLNAFKVLGGSYAIGQIVATRVGIPRETLTYTKLLEEETKRRLGETTFISATDGNHGRGVAWMARQIGQKAIVYMPKGSAQERFENIAREGANVTITPYNYDDAVRAAAADSKKNGWLLVQDTAWDGYEDIPTWIMQGYTTIAKELEAQLQEERITHIFIQAGVGSFAGAVLGYFANRQWEKRPVMVVVEPEKANCLYRTAKANDGTRHFTSDDMQTIMAGLACGEPNTVSWEILRQCADFFLSIPEYVAAQGMRILANPLGGDARVVAGESGAAAFGSVLEILRNDDYRTLRQTLGLDGESRILFVNSEGDTDKKSYLDIVWDGAYSREDVS